MQDQLCVVTGAFGYSGRYVAERFLEQGARVRTLTNSPPGGSPLADRVEAHPFNFDQPQLLTESLRGAAVLVNTYWVRFNHARFKHADAVENTKMLFKAAKEAGVGRVVHVSITNSSKDSPFEYFRGKAELEEALLATDLPVSIVRPAVLFGQSDILVNNIAWALRKLPLFGVFGDGEYGIEPIHVEDFADLIVAESGQTGNRTVDAVGPEAFTYRELVRVIGECIGVPRKIIGVPPLVGWLAGKILGLVTGDVTITRAEIGGLMAGLLATGSPPVGTTRLTTWAEEHRDTLGVTYANELGRRA